jgi:hypothetical protein
MIPEKQTQVIEITLIRDGHFYLYNRYINERADPMGKVISRERALEIFNNNKASQVIRRMSQVDFTEEQPRHWEWTVRITIEIEPEETAV